MLWTGMHGRIALEQVMPRFPCAPMEAHVDALIAAHIGRPDGSEPVGGRASVT
jgi:hypothetical protein